MLLRVDVVGVKWEDVGVTWREMNAVAQVLSDLGMDAAENGDMAAGVILKNAANKIRSEAIARKNRDEPHSLIGNEIEAIPLPELPEFAR